MTTSRYGNTNRFTGPVCRETTDDCGGFPAQKDSDTELWELPYFWPEQVKE